MSIDDEIERAVSSVTPTQSAVPAPAVLAEMRAAMRIERRMWRMQRALRAVNATATVLGYLTMAGAAIQLLASAIAVVCR